MEKFSLFKKLKDLLQTKTMVVKPSLSNAAWYMDFWEKLISVVKRCLKKTVSKFCLNYFELQVVLSEIKFILNSRSLS